MKELNFIILDNYQINKNTIALFPATHTAYQSIVFEADNMIYVKQTPMQLIASACIRGGSSYDGRRIAAVKLLNIFKKVPIAINTHENIYAFPSCSPANFHCQWMFYAHVQQMEDVPNEAEQCSITCSDGKQYIIHASTEIMKKQWYRTALCVHTFSPLAKQYLLSTPHLV